MEKPKKRKLTHDDYKLGGYVHCLARWPLPWPCSMNVTTIYPSVGWITTHISLALLVHITWPSRVSPQGAMARILQLVWQFNCSTAFNQFESGFSLVSEEEYQEEMKISD